MKKIEKLHIFALVKKVVILFALFLLAKPLIPLAKYIVFYDYYVNVLCENKQEPESTCNGTCHLKQELADNANDHLPQNTSKFSEFELVYCNQLFDFNFFTPKYFAVQNYAPVGYFTSYFYSEVPKPPIA